MEMQSLKLPCVVLALTIILSVVQSKNITKGSGCYYKGSFHHGNWSDGCEFTCTCLNIDTGHYKCKTRCPVYHQLPHGCVLKLPIGEECCRQPDCSAVTVPYTIITGGNNGSYNNNTTNSNNSNTSDNGNSNKNNAKTNISGNNENNYNDNNSNNGVNGNNNGTKDGNNNNTSNMNDHHINKINNRSDSSDVRMSNVSNNSDISTTSNSSDYINNNNQNNSVSNDYHNYKVLTTTSASNVNTSVKALQAEEEKGCLYKGTYHNGSWTDGCKMNCTCDDPILGTYSCHNRCREYTDIEPGCALELSSVDNCCWVPECNITEIFTALEHTNNTEAINNTENYTKFINTKHIDYITKNEHFYNATNIDNIENNATDINSDKFITTTDIATATPTTLPPIFVKVTKAPRDVPKVTSNLPYAKQLNNFSHSENKGYEVIKGINETHIGNSEVANATETEKLAIIFSRFGPIRLFTVKKDINIEAINKDEQHNEINNVTGKDNLKNHHGYRQAIIQTKDFVSDNSYLVTVGVCKYKSKTFKQDERWNDGCNATCVCENAARGIYKCRSRCKEYKALPIGCTMRQSNIDNCCLVPDCRHATVANGNHVFTTSRVLSKIQQIGKTEMSLLKKMFNHRNKLRNKQASPVKEKVIGVEVTRQLQNVPIVTLTSGLHRQNFQQFEHAVDQTNISSANLQNYYKQPNYYQPNKSTNIRSLHANKLTHKQEIVTPYNLINSHREFKRRSNRRYNNARRQSFRTIATQTGLYKVRKKDGVISPQSDTLTNDIISKPDKLTSSRNRDDNNTSGFCQYRNRRYMEGDTLFDGCERKCICQSSGKFICKQRCPVHRSVPSGCALLSPRAGQCCSTLICRRIPTRNNPPASYFDI